MKTLIKNFIFAVACLAISGIVTPAVADSPFMVMNYRDRFQGEGNATRIFTNTNEFPLILDVFNIQSSTGEPIFLQVSNTGIIYNAPVGPVGNYAFLMTGQWPPASSPGENPGLAPSTMYFCNVNTSIVILPGDSFRGYSLNGASFSISISGHYNYGPFPFPPY